MTFSLFLLTIMLFKTSFQQGLYRRVYLDSHHGTNDLTCGKTSLAPCKDLNVAVRRVTPSGTIIITGSQVLKKSILLEKSFSLVAETWGVASLKGMGKVSHMFHLLSQQAQRKATRKRNEKNQRHSRKGRAVRNDHQNRETRKKRSVTRKKMINLYISGIDFDRVGLLDMDKNEQYEITVTITNSTFTNARNIIKQNKKRDKISRRKSAVHITNSLFFLSGEMMCQYMSSVHLQNCTFESTRGRNAGALYIRYTDAADIIGCRFLKGVTKPTAGGFIYIKFAENVQIRDCHFQSGRAESKGGAINVNFAKQLLIHKSIFMSCKSGSGGAISIVNPTNMYIQQCRFIRNEAGFGGAIHVNTVLRLRMKKDEGYGTKIEDIYFINNKARVLGQAIYYSGPVNLTNIKISTREETDASQVHLEGERTLVGNLRLNTSLAVPIQSNMARNGITITSLDFQLYDKIIYKCPRHFNVHLDENKYMDPKIKFKNGKESGYKWTLFMAKCVSCPSDMYTLETGKVVVSSIKYVKLQQKIREGKCLKCPSGALCNGNIQPLDGFWGYKEKQTNELKFIQCPNGYCCSSDTTPCNDYNTCNTGRTGTLCGSCGPDYDQSFVSSGCIKKIGIDCNSAIFIIYFVVASLLYTVVFTFTSRIINLFKTRHASKRKPDTEQIRIAERGTEHLEMENVKRGIQEQIQLPISAYVTLLILFFQVSSLVHVKIHQQRRGHDEENSSQNSFLKAIFSIFNFRLTIYRKLCPMNGLTLPTKEFINVGLKLCSIFNLLFFYILWKCFCLMRSCIWSDSRSNVVTESDAKGLQNLSFQSVLKIGFIKLVKLNYTSISTFTFHMIHCVSIGSHLHLYLYGDQECYTVWQYMILFALPPVVVLFPLSFGLSLNLLKNGFVSTDSFLVSTVVPYYTFFLYTKKLLVGLKQHSGSTEDDKCAAVILEMEEMLFKEDDQMLRWPVVQFYRNLLVVVLNTFVLNRFYMTISYFVVFVCFLLHDRYRMPYKHPYLNCLQTLTSAALIIVNACAIPASTSTILELWVVPEIRVVSIVRKYLELLMYACVPLSLPVWKLWEKCRRR